MRAESGFAAGLSRPYPAPRQASMQSPGPSDTWFTVAAVLVALPCGYCFGVVAAFLLAGGADVGATPLLTVPLGLIASAALALLPLLEAQTRFAIMVAGAIAAAVVYFMVLSAFP